MLKKFVVLIAVFFALTFTFSLLTFNSALGADEFLIDSTVEYKVDEFLTGPFSSLVPQRAVITSSVGS